ncbi:MULTISPECIES: hypothetical protein [unclassified Paraburkholderia]|uniref:hypothetical protein n=1 Tax=unclassified Paraburkholderia TaxID=2615204 RepID=UPI00197E2E2C|nr:MULTISPECIES: hypothetical protein [unclassified Paraburkholderia]MBN3856614.1 hypothetical protein [Paraburkholderia sp. Ac-20340]
MQRIFRNSAALLAVCTFLTSACASQLVVVSLDVRQVGDKPALCFASDDEYMQDAVKLADIGVVRATGIATPVETYWEVEIPESAPPVILHHGDCIVYGQAIDGAKVVTPPKPLDSGMLYTFGISTRDNKGGPIYAGGFCAWRKPGNGLRIERQRKKQYSCSSDTTRP